MNNVIRLGAPDPSVLASVPTTALEFGNIVDLQPGRAVGVELPAGEVLACEVLVAPVAIPLELGSRVLVARVGVSGIGVVLGITARYGDGPVPDKISIQAGHSVEMKCGESSIDLRADGKVMIRGDDVLVRAKGTKRIRAGSVSIN